MPDIVNDYFVPTDLIHDQIVADGKTPEGRFPRCLAYVRRFGNARSHLLYASNETSRGVPVVLRDVFENLFKISERAAFIPKLHALR